MGFWHTTMSLVACQGCEVRIPTMPPTYSDLIAPTIPS